MTNQDEVQEFTDMARRAKPAFYADTTWRALCFAFGTSIKTPAGLPIAPQPWVVNLGEFRQRQP